MPKKILIVFTLFIVGLSARLSGQELLRKVFSADYTITAKNLADESPAHQIFGSIAINNTMSLYQLKIYWQANVFVSLKTRGEEVKTLDVKVLNQQLGGTTSFRGFALDSILLPGSLDAILHVQFSAGDSVSFPVKLLTSGETTSIPLPGHLVFDPDSVRLSLSIEHANYSQHSEQAFNQVSTLINLYYAYNEILKQFTAASGTRLAEKNHSASVLFLACHHIGRINAYIRQHDFSGRLSLEKNDPLGFLKRYSITLRMEKRAATLFRQALKGGKEKAPSDKEKYCRAYAQLSQKYLDRAAHLQPNIAGGFVEMAGINPTKEEKRKLSEVAAYYDVWDQLDEPPTAELIFVQFIQLAQHASGKKQFVAALRMLQNAAQIEECFDTAFESANWRRLYSKSLDGLMSSYLSVSLIAYKSGKLQMADEYYHKALLVFEQYGSPLVTSKTDELLFQEFTALQVELSKNLLTDRQWLKALALLKQARQIRNCKLADSLCREIDSLTKLAHQGIFNRKMEQVDKWLGLENFDKALAALDSAKKFTCSFQNSFRPVPVKDFEQRAEVVFQAFFLRGNRLLNSSQPDQALSYFLKAREVEKEYLPARDSLLQSLLNNATVPVILAKIDSASFETWANRLEKANSLYHEARQIQLNYRQQNNTELNAAFLALETKMEQRKCMNINYRIVNMNELTQNAVRAKEFDKAEVLLKETGLLISNGKNCKPDSTQTLDLRRKYARIFEFRHRLEKTERYLKELKFDSVVIQLVSLQVFYKQHQLEEFGLEQPSLEEYVSEKKIPGLTKAAILYFAHDDNFIRALHFLDMLKNQQLTAWEAREVQLKVGKGIAHLNINEEEEKRIGEYTDGDNWYIYFKLARLSANVLK